MVRSRDLSIDFVRTAAIILMIFAHANMILRIESNPVNNFFQNLGNAICFALFLFCAGASAYYSTNKTPPSLKRTLKRIGVIYFSYAIVCILNLIEANSLNLNSIFKYLTFMKLPAYGEFLAAFILFEIIFFIFYKQFIFLCKSIPLIILASILSFLIGDFLSKVDFGSLNFISILFFGGNNQYSFPVFQYAGFFLLGNCYANKRATTKLRARTVLDITTVSILIILLILYFFKSISLHNLRWPPSASFLLVDLLGLMVVISMYFFLRYFIKKENVNYKSALVLSASPSRLAIHIFYIHLIVLYSLRWIGVPGSFITPYIVLLLILAIVLAIFYAKKKTKKRTSSLETHSR